MATYIVLVDFTEKGIQNVKDSPKRADSVSALGERLGVKVKSIWWTSGRHDGVLVIEAPDDAGAARFTLSIGRMGNVRTRTLRAFDRSEMESILRGVE